MNLHFIQLNATSARLACVVNVVSCVSVFVVPSLQFNNLGPESCIVLRDLLLDPNSSVRSLQ